jgi:Fe-S-cluster containining protein
MTPDCLVCRGACCEQLVIPRMLLPKANRDYFRARGTLTEAGLVLECRCPKLSREGLCSIYEIRPVVCRTYEPGSQACEDAIFHRRTVSEVEEIHHTQEPKP